MLIHPLHLDSNILLFHRLSCHISLFQYHCWVIFISHLIISHLFRIFFQCKFNLYNAMTLLLAHFVKQTCGMGLSHFEVHTMPWTPILKAIRWLQIPTIYVSWSLVHSCLIAKIIPHVILNAFSLHLIKLITTYGDTC